MSDEMKLLTEIRENITETSKTLQAVKERQEKGDSAVAGLEGVTSETAAKLTKLDENFQGALKRLEEHDKALATRKLHEDFSYQRKHELSENMEKFNVAVRAEGGHVAGAPKGGFTDINEYALYEEAFVDALSRNRMRRLEEREGSSSDKFKMALAIQRGLRLSIDDSSQSNGGALLPEAFAGMIDQTGRLQSAILGKVTTMPTSINEVERILATSTTVQRGRGARVAADPVRGTRGGTGDSNPDYLEQKLVVSDCWTRPYVHEDTLEDSPFTVREFLLAGVAMDFMAEEEMQCINGTATVSEGVHQEAANGAWQGIFGGGVAAANIADGTGGSSFNPYATSSTAADDHLFKPVFRVKTGVNGTLGATTFSTAQAANYLYDRLVDLQMSITHAYRGPKACFIMSTNTLAAVRKIKDADGNPVFTMDRNEAGVYRPMLMGREIVEAEHAPDVGPSTGASATNGTCPIAFGDFSRGYTRAKRRGLRMRMLDHEPPYVSFYFSKRDKGGVYDTKAFSLLRAIA